MFLVCIDAALVMSDAFVSFLGCNCVNFSQVSQDMDVLWLKLDLSTIVCRDYFTESTEVKDVHLSHILVPATLN